MPWQQLVADVGGEIDPKTGRFVYRKVVVLVPRQSGKTILDLSENVFRAWGFGEPQRITYTAQTRNDARGKWVEQEKILRRSPFGETYDLREAAGSEEWRWHNGSIHSLTATMEKSGHGFTLDKGTIDEAWAQVDKRVEQAMRPAMITRPDAQMWVLSTAGNLTSIYLNEEIAKGRERILSGDPSSVAYFEWSFDPDDDPGSVDTWLRTMPALNRTTAVSSIQAEYDDMSLRDFMRAYGNITDTGTGADAVVSPESWEATGDDSSQIVGPRCFALDVASDRSWAAVGWAGVNQYGDPHFEVVRYDRGTHWVIRYLVKKLAQNKAMQVAVVGASQAGLMVEDLETAGIEPLILSRADYAAGCARLYDTLTNRTARHKATGQVALDIAVAGAAWSTGDTRIWSRVVSTTDISPLVAATVATWAYQLSLEDGYNIIDSIA